jgi:hypothetical protein
VAIKFVFFCFFKYRKFRIPHNKNSLEERERERMAVITELGEGESAGLGLGHNSDVCIFLR